MNTQTLKSISILLNKIFNEEEIQFLSKGLKFDLKNKKNFKTFVINSLDTRK